jgi:cysteinyl-tRNA synthetase
MGLLAREPRSFLQGGVGFAPPLVSEVIGNQEDGIASATAAAGFSNIQIEEKIVARTSAKKAKNFAEADRIRNELLTGGIILEDKPGGITEWRRA